MARGDITRVRLSGQRRRHGADGNTMRPRTVSIERARRVWESLWRSKGGMPTVAEYASALGVGSTRTAFRYKALVFNGEKCKHCGGRGWKR